MKKESWIATQNGCMFILKIVEKDGVKTIGSVQPLFGESPLVFRDEGSALLAIDRLMDAVGGPVSMQELNENKTDKEENTKKYEVWLKEEKEKGCIVREVTEEEEEQRVIGLFYICIKYRRNMSWQGEIQWNGKGPVYFRSELELIHLIQSALEVNED